MKKRLIAMLLTSIMLLSLMPLTAMAEEPAPIAVKLHGASIKDYETKGSVEITDAASLAQAYDIVYLGGKAYFVLNVGGNGQSFTYKTEDDGVIPASYTDDAGSAVAAENALFLVAKDSIGNNQFHSANDTTHYWSRHTGTLWSKLNDPESSEYKMGSLSDAELAAVLRTAKDEPALTIKAEDGYNGWTGTFNQTWSDESTDPATTRRSSDLLGDKFFPLSVWEIVDPQYGLNTNAARLAFVGGAHCWLRSSYPTTGCGIVHGASGGLNSVTAANSYAVRPALNLNLTSVIFESDAAEGRGKSSASEASGFYFSNLADSDTSSWKLTLRDDELTLGECAIFWDICDESYVLRYDGASTEAPEGYTLYVSAVILNDDGDIVSYGRLGEIDESGAGSISFALPEDTDTTKVRLFAEACSADQHMSDYASEFSDVTIERSDYADVDAMKTAMEDALKTYTQKDVFSGEQLLDIWTVGQNAVPYPDGATDDSLFYVEHMAEGDIMEYPAVTKDTAKDTISFNLDSCSPVLIAYIARDVAEAGETKTYDEDPADYKEVIVKAGGTVKFGADPAEWENLHIIGDSGVKLVSFDYKNTDDTTPASEFKAIYGVAAGSTLFATPNLQSKTVGETGYYFKGWTPEGTAPALTSETEFYADAAYTAQWETLNMKVTLTPSKSLIKVGGGVLIDVSVKDDVLPTWNNAKLVIDYDEGVFTWSDSNDPDVTCDGDKITIQVYGNAKVSGEVVKTLSFVAAGETEEPLSENNFTVDESSTVDTAESAAVVDVTAIAAVENCAVEVIAADKDIYKVTLGNGMKYAINALNGLEIKTVVEDGAAFSGSLDDYDVGYTYTFTANGNTVDPTNATVNPDGTFSIANEVFTQDTVLQVSRVVTGLAEDDVAIFSDFVAGYTLVLVDAGSDIEAANLAYSGANLFVADGTEYNTLVADALRRELADIGDVYAYIVKGSITKAELVAGVTISKSAQDKLDSARYDVNDTDAVDLNDVQAAYSCYNVEYAMTRAAMAEYIRADVNNSGRVDTTDVVLVLGQLA